MAPLPANSTSVYFVDYTFQGEERSMQFRYIPGTTLSNVIVMAQNFLDALRPWRVISWQVTGARNRNLGDTISLPVEAPAPQAGSAVDIGQVDYPRFVSFVGRGPQTGRRVRVFVYGLNFTTPGDYRLQSTESGVIDAARAVLDAAGPGIATTIAGDDPLWYLYANVGYNSYYERKART